MIFFFYQFSVNLWAHWEKEKKINILQTLNEQACSACFGNTGPFQPVLDKTGKDSYQCVVTSFPFRIRYSQNEIDYFGQQWT